MGTRPDPREPLVLVVGAAAASMAIGVPVGIWAALYRNRAIDVAARILSLIQASGSYPGAAFPYLSSNLGFAADASWADRPDASAPRAGRPA